MTLCMLHADLGMLLGFITTSRSTRWTLVALLQVTPRRCCRTAPCAHKLPDRAARHRQQLLRAPPTQDEDKILQHLQAEAKSPQQSTKCWSIVYTTAALSEL